MRDAGGKDGSRGNVIRTLRQGTVRADIYRLVVDSSGDASPHARAIAQSREQNSPRPLIRISAFGCLVAAYNKPRTTV